MSGGEVRFIVDSMLGRLAKWLRIMGYDAHYQQSYKQGEIEALIDEGRIFVTRKKQWEKVFPSATIITSDHVGEQLKELKHQGLLASPLAPFTRCIRCNVPLTEVDITTVSQRVPEYILYEAGKKIKHCPSCKRCYWAGTHKDRMRKQLRLWGVSLAQ